MKYKIGQRIRLIHTNNRHDMKNAEGVILSSHMYPMYVIDYPGHKLSPGKKRFISHHDEIEPIKYDGNKKVSWSDCLWRPNKTLCDA